MLEAYGDIWKARPRPDAIVVTTNGFVKKNGEAVMGRGIALEAKTLYPELPAQLGAIIQYHGNIAWLFEFDRWNGEADYQDWILTLPVKPSFGPNGVMGWKAKADITLIKEQLPRMIAFVDEVGMKRVYMPRPGCGNGGLKWEAVKPVIEPYLDDRFTVFHKEI